MSRLHDILMARGRTVINRVQGRSVTYIPPESTGGAPIDVTALYASARDELVESDRGLQNMRVLFVNVEIGSGIGQAPDVQVDGLFMIDVDGAEAVPWTVKDFDNTDAPAGFKRCRCVRPIHVNGVVGMNRPR